MRITGRVTGTNAITQYRGWGIKEFYKLILITNILRVDFSQKLTFNIIN